MSAFVHEAGEITFCNNMQTKNESLCRKEAKKPFLGREKVGGSKGIARG